MSGHTPEKWHVEEGRHAMGDTGDYESFLILRDDQGLEIACVYDLDRRDDIEADHIFTSLTFAADSTNACRGMADPAATIKAVRDALEAVAKDAETFSDRFGLYLMPHTAELCATALRMMRAEQ